MAPSRTAPALVALAAAAALAAAFAMQHLGGLAPCMLCVWQRYPYGVAIVLGLIGVAVAGRPGALRLVLALAGLVFLVDAGIAAYHVGVEQGWWEGSASCTGALPANATIEELRKAIEGAPLVRCNEVPWSFAGVSIAGFNFLFALACALATLWAAAAIRPRPASAYPQGAYRRG